MKSREELNKEVQEELDDDYKRERNKKIVTILFKVIAITIILFTSFYLYIKYISTNNIIVKEKRLISKKIPESFSGIKIIHFSDLLLGSSIDIDDIDKVIKIINIRKPDLVIYNGNLIDKNYEMNNKKIEEVIYSLSKINTTIGKYAILSDNDTEDVKTILKQSGFIFLEDTSELIYNKDNNPILLSFLSNDIDKTFEYYKGENVNKDIYNILILKNPDDIDKVIDNYNIDLALSGKSLNGQICLYNDLCFIKFNGAKKYYKEYYKVNNTKLFISSGIGSPNPNFRFMARPSINFFRLATK